MVFSASAVFPSSFMDCVFLLLNVTHTYIIPFGISFTFNKNQPHKHFTTKKKFFYFIFFIFLILNYKLLIIN